MSKEKRITFLIFSLSGGGAEAVCINMANGLADKGWQIDLLVLHLNNTDYLSRVSDKVNLVVLGANHARNALIKLRKYLLQAKPEKVLVFNYELAVLLVIIRALFRYRFTLIARNISTFSAKRSADAGFWRKQVVTRLIDLLYSKVDHVINQCKGMEADLLSFFPSLAGKTSVIYNPANKIVEDAAQKIDLSAVKKEDYLLCVGRLETVKAFHYALQALAEVSKQHPNVMLKIVGQGSLENDLKQQAKDLGIADKVAFEGFQHDMAPYYLKARATLLTSLYEGFPNALIESITLGTPVVAFDCPSGPREIIQEGENGYLVAYKNQAALNEAIHKVLGKDWSATQIAQTAKTFSSQAILLQYEKALS